MSDLHCPARFLVARHGEAEYESEAMTAAGGSLTALGRDQARALGERLGGERVAGIVTSDLARAVQTAEIAARVLDLPVKVREGLHEFPPGDFRGRPYDHAFFGAMAQAWLAGDLGVGVPGGETGRQTADRVLAVLDDARRPVPRGDRARGQPRRRDPGAVGRDRSGLARRAGSRPDRQLLDVRARARRRSSI